MKRRTLIAGAAGLVLSGAAARAQNASPWRVDLLGGANHGRYWLLGVRIGLDDGWKTYWRVPGDSGIPPEFRWTGAEAFSSVEVLYPVPSRFRDASGESLGYKREVVFPVRVMAAEPPREGTLGLELRLAACREVCIPVTAAASLDLLEATADSPDDDIIGGWLARVPLPGTIVSGAALAAGKPALAVTLAEPASDIFVEGAEGLYFNAPLLAEGGLAATIAVDNVKDIETLRRAPLRFTVVTATGAIDQTVKVG
ncbi:MAG: hypothetical protein HY245_09350 [Rhizobiales bacterium]|nr:hypothetical protein [Hyphomicrobiales bacterium]MBI3673607.1 hypothetical protein [Hyphomicrobiales bacterium]